MTDYWKVYDAFLNKMTEDEYVLWTEEEAAQDMRGILESAIPYFKFPRISLDRNDDGFIEDLGSEEIQILAVHMRREWLSRSIISWDNVKPLYTERDFSPANMLSKLRELLGYETLQAARLEDFYYRSIKGKSYQYSKLAGNGQA